MTCLTAVCCVLLVIYALPVLGAADAGETRVARWKDDRKGAFVLMFDDNCISHVQHAIPELQKRSMIGTFYVNPGSPHWAQFAADWQGPIAAAGMEYGNHTFTHAGAADFADADKQFGQCNEAILKIISGGKRRLLSYGRPGVPQGKWNISDAEEATLLEKYDLVKRPPFSGHGGLIDHKTAQTMVQLADKAIANGTMEYLIFHGVGGDWISIPLPVFTELLDQLQTRRDRLWITGHATAVKYATERDSARVQVMEQAPSRLTLSLTTAADPALYDEPLTLVTKVPSDWKSCRVTQGAAQKIDPVHDGEVVYDAAPGTIPIVLTNVP